MVEPPARVDQALKRAVDNSVKKLILQPTHLMHGAEYDEMKEAVEAYKDKFESVSIAEPFLGEVGSDAASINADKAAVAEYITDAAVKASSFDTREAAKESGTAFVFMGHGTSHTANITYSQMQTQMKTLGYDNVFIGTVEGKPEETSAENVIKAVKEAGYKNVILRPLMVVAGDHANNDMAGDDDDSWKSMFTDAGLKVDVQIEGLGRIEGIVILSFIKLSLNNLISPFNYRAVWHHFILYNLPGRNQSIQISSRFYNMLFYFLRLSWSRHRQAGMRQYMPVSLTRPCPLPPGMS